MKERERGYANAINRTTVGDCIVVDFCVFISSIVVCFIGIIVELGLAEIEHLGNNNVVVNYILGLCT